MFPMMCELYHSQNTRHKIARKSYCASTNMSSEFTSRARLKLSSRTIYNFLNADPLDLGCISSSHWCKITVCWPDHPSASKNDGRSWAQRKFVNRIAITCVSVEYAFLTLKGGNFTKCDVVQWHICTCSVANVNEKYLLAPFLRGVHFWNFWSF